MKSKHVLIRNNKMSKFEQIFFETLNSSKIKRILSADPVRGYMHVHMAKHKKTHKNQTSKNCLDKY